MTLKKGDLFGSLNYFVVHEVRKNMVIFRDLRDGREWGLPLSHADEIMEYSCSADIVDREEKASLSRIIDKLLTSGYKPFTVEFVKQNGEERVLRGAFIEHEQKLGRSIVQDLDKGDDGICQVDHRTIKSLIIDGVKYVRNN